MAERAATAERGRRRRMKPGSRQRRFRLPELALGVALVAGGGLGAVLWATHEPSQRVLVAARPIRRGETMEAGMLRWATVSGDHIAGLTDTAGLGGRIATIDIAAGSPLQASLFRPATVVGVDQIEYGLALAPGDFPVGLAVGDDVMVVVLPRPEPDGQLVAPVTLPQAAEVLVAPVEDDPVVASTAGVVINLLVSRADLELLATAADVRLARLPEGDRAMIAGA